MGTRSATRLRAVRAAIAVCTLTLSAAASADHAERTYEVRVTNLTAGQTFTPLLVVSHRPGLRFFEPGTPASPELATLAEAGDTAPLEALLLDSGLALDTGSNGGLLEPGDTAVIEVRGGGRHDRISLAGMLIPTNDTFVALGDLRLSPWRTRSAVAIAYDAGSEENDQACAHIPGPRCGGEDVSLPAAGDEGFVHVSRGFHDLGPVDADGGEVLGPFLYDWRNPVASVSVRRIR